MIVASLNGAPAAQVRSNRNPSSTIISTKALEDAITVTLGALEWGN